MHRLRSPVRLQRLAFIVVLALAARAVAADPPPTRHVEAPAPVTQMWLVDTRCAPGCGDLEAGLAQIRYWRLVESSGCCQWQAADAAAFQASSDPALPTTVQIHGYGTNSDWAVQHGNDLYADMKQLRRGTRLRVAAFPAGGLVLAGLPRRAATARDSRRHTNEGLPQRRGSILSRPRAIRPAARRATKLIWL